MLTPIACTEERLRANARMLRIQDTTELDYAKKKGIAGIAMSSCGIRWGTWLHPTPAVMPKYVPPGSLDSQT